MSRLSAALKLNGTYLGVIGGFERFTEAELSPPLFAEAQPQGTGGVAFFIDEKLLKAPPAFLDVYLLYGGDALLYIKEYPPQGGELKVLSQARVGGTTATLFNEGGKTYLSCDGEGINLYTLDDGFNFARLCVRTVGGYDVICAEGEGRLCVIGEGGRRVFYNAAESWSFGETLKVIVAFNTCADCAAECEFSYDGREMKLVKSFTRERAEVEEGVRHFAFFESVLTHGDFEKYLSDELRPRAGDINKFLGDFIDVTVPHSRFFEGRESALAAGLVYVIGKNLFSVKYYCVEEENGKITNISEVE